MESTGARHIKWEAQQTEIFRRNKSQTKKRTDGMFLQSDLYLAMWLTAMRFYQDIAGYADSYTNGC